MISFSLPVLALGLGLMTLYSTAEVESLWFLPSIFIIAFRLVLLSTRFSKIGVSDQFLAPLTATMFPLAFGIYKMTTWHPLIVGAHLIPILAILLLIQKPTSRVAAFKISLAFVSGLLGGALSPELHTGTLILLTTLVVIISLFFNNLKTYETPRQQAPLVSVSIFGGFILVGLGIVSFFLFPLLPRPKVSVGWMGGGSGFNLKGIAQVGFSGEVLLSPTRRWEASNNQVSMRFYFADAQSPQRVFFEAFPEGLVPLRTLELFDGFQWLSRSRSEDFEIKRVETNQELPQSPKVEIIKEPTGKNEIPQSKNYSLFLNIQGLSEPDPIIKKNKRTGDLQILGSGAVRSRFWMTPTPIGTSDYQTPTRINLQVPSKLTQSPAWSQWIFSKDPNSKSTREHAENIKSQMDQHFKANRFEWALQSQSSSKQGIDLLDDFLFYNRKGHCELFATAAALIFRLNGVPSRLVTGYRVDPPEQSYLVVREQTAHAWVEFYDGSQWIPYDPTPPVELSSIAPENFTSSFVRYFAELEESLSALWFRSIVEFDPSRKSTQGVNWRNLIQSVFKQTEFRDKSIEPQKSRENLDSNERFNFQNRIGAGFLFLMIFGLGTGLWLVVRFLTPSASLLKMPLVSALSLWVDRIYVRNLMRKTQTQSLRELKRILDHSQLDAEARRVRDYELRRFKPKG